jgi:hypothetical protein
MTLFLLSLIISVSFVALVHFLVKPLVKRLYLKYEPLAFHYEYKLRKRVERHKKNLKKTWLKVRYFLR